MNDKTSALEKAIKIIKLSNDPDVLKSLLNLKMGKVTSLLKSKSGRILKEAKGGLVKKNKGGLMVAPKRAKRGY